jgi:hypothetical protein
MTEEEITALLKRVEMLEKQVQTLMMYMALQKDKKMDLKRLPF